MTGRPAEPLPPVPPEVFEATSGFPGVAASPGIAIGKAYLVGSAPLTAKKTKLTEALVPKELDRLHTAVEVTRQDIEAIKNRVAREVGYQEAEIFNAYLHILSDPLIVQAAEERVKSERVNAEWALQSLAGQLTGQLAASSDEYLRERAVDMNDVVGRVLAHLTGEAKVLLSDGEEEVIVVANDLTPSQTASMKHERVIGFTTNIGGRTSHVAIMARSLEIPAVVGLKDITTRVKHDDLLVVDGSLGVVVVNPDAKLLAKYRAAQQKILAANRKLKKLKGVTAVTADGYRLTVAANIELPDDIRQARKYGAEGIGLFRTEFLYLNRRDLPTEQEQYEAYKLVAHNSLPYATIIRTLDLGGDKFISRLGTSNEMNPFLGLRAIRLCLAHPDLFKIQLRAILRASEHGKIKVMFPMVSDVEELRQAKALLEECKHELSQQRVPFDRKLEVGIMIELPSAALTADVLAKEAQFFSLGTNDLIQYTLAADRVNEKVAYLYNPLHPSILRLIDRVIKAAHERKRWVGMCGEMAADPLLTPLLVGLGLDEFSTGPAFVPQVKKSIREVQFSACRELAAAVLKCSTSREVEALLRRNSNQEVNPDEPHPEA